jgi:hypothetical protein
VKIIERSPFRGTTGPISLNDRLQGIWRHGLAWNQELAAQDQLAAQLGRLLNNSYTIIRNVSLPTLYVPVPWVLIGPIGVHVYYASSLKGIFRARGDGWAELDNKNRQYVPSRPNLIRRVALMSRALQDYLAEKKLHLEAIEPVLFFAHPGIHIESIEPAVRLLQLDGIDRFIASELLEEPRLNSEDVERIVELLTTSRSRTPESTTRQDIGLSTREPVGVGKLRMQPWQWLVIGVLILLWFLIIIIGALLLLNS